MQKSLKLVAAGVALASCLSIGATSSIAKGSSGQVSVQPILCDLKHDASKISFVTVSSATVLEVTLADQGDYGGVLFGNVPQFPAGTGSVVLVATPTSTSANIIIRLALVANVSGKKTVYDVPATSVARNGLQDTYTFDLSTSKVPSGATVEKIAAVAIQTGTSGGSVLFDTFNLNGTQVTKHNLTVGGCL